MFVMGILILQRLSNFEMGPLWGLSVSVNCVIIGLDNGMSPAWHQSIIT